MDDRLYKDDLFSQVQEDMNTPFLQGNKGTDNFNNNSGGSLFDNGFGSNDQNLFGNNQVNQQQAPDQAPDFSKDFIGWIVWALGKFIKKFFELLMSGITLIIDVVTSFSTLGQEKILKTFKVILICSFIIFGASIACAIIGYNTDVLGLENLGYLFIGASSINILGPLLLTLIISAASYKPQTEEQLDKMIAKEVDEKEVQACEELGNEYEQTFDDIMNDIMAEDSPQEAPAEDTGDDWFNDSEPEQVSEPEPIEEEPAPVVAPVDYNNFEVSDTSDSLFGAFSGLFPKFNPDFAKTESITPSDKRFNEVKSLILEIFTNIYQGEMEKVIDDGITLIGWEDSIMSATLKVRRPKKKQVPVDALENGLYEYQKLLLPLLTKPSQLYDTEVDPEAINELTFNVVLEGANYNITVVKPFCKPILLGDVFIKPNVQKFMSTQKDIPMVVAVDEQGNTIMKEFGKKSKEVYSALIGGGAGSGKTQFFASLSSQMVAFNEPKDLQMILYDPKGDNIFNTLALAPQVCRLIQGGSPKEAEQILEVLDTLVNKEAPRRQEVFHQANCSSIQEYRKKGHTMPTIILFIDELLTVNQALQDLTALKYKEAVEEYEERKANKEKGLTKPKEEDMLKKFRGIMSVAVTKLRSAGIYTFVISHRFTGSVDKTTREQCSFRCALRSEKLKREEFEAKELQNCTKKLLNAGDAAIKIGEADVKGGKTLCATLSDDETYTLFRTIAKAYYKRGVEIPTEELKHLGPAYIKDLDKVKEELFADEKELVKFGNEEDTPKEETIEQDDELAFDAEEETNDGDSTEDAFDQIESSDESEEDTPEEETINDIEEDKQDEEDFPIVDEEPQINLEDADNNSMDDDDFDIFDEEDSNTKAKENNEEGDIEI